MNHRQQFKASNRRIGQRLDRVRQQQQMTLPEIAAISGISLRRINQFETGQQMISAAELSLLAETYEMPIEFFIHHEPLLDWVAEWQMLHSYRLLRPEQQEQIVRMVLDIVGDLGVSLRE